MLIGFLWLQSDFSLAGYGILREIMPRCGGHGVGLQQCTIACITILRLHVIFKKLGLTELWTGASRLLFSNLLNAPLPLLLVLRSLCMRFGCPHLCQAKYFFVN